MLATLPEQLPEESNPSVKEYKYSRHSVASNHRYRFLSHVKYITELYM